jgi:hypothetical protein
MGQAFTDREQGNPQADYDNTRPATTSIAPKINVTRPWTGWRITNA